MIRHSRIAVALAVSTAALGQGVVTTVAGTGWILPRLTLPATDTPLGFVRHIRLDRDGNPLLLDAFNHMVFRASNGTLTAVVGNGLAGPAGDEVIATRAALAFPNAFATDAAGNIYIADDGSSYIRKVDTRGVISVIAGVGVRQPADGLRALDVTFGTIESMAVLPSGDLLVADQAYSRVFRIDATGTVRLFAGNGGNQCGAGIPGRATAAAICDPRFLVADRQGNAYFTSAVSLVSRGTSVRRVAPDGTISTFAGNGQLGRPAAGAAAAESALEPVSLAIDASGRMVIASGFVSTTGQRQGDLVRVAADGKLEILPAEDFDDVVPMGMAALPDGSYLVSSFQPTRVVRIRPDGKSELFAGNGKFGFGGDGGPANLALLNGPAGLAVDDANNLYIADGGNGRVRKVDPQGTISTVAGNGQFVKEVNLSDLATAAPVEWPLLLPTGVAAATNGILAFTSTFGVHFMGQNTLLTAGWTTTTPGGIAFNGTTAETYQGIVFTDSAKHLAFRANADATFALVAGTGSPGSTGDGGPGDKAALNGPSGVAVGPDRSFYIAEASGHRIRKVAPDGTISTFAGNGRASGARMPAGPVAATGVALTNPTGLAMDPGGNLWVKSAGHISRITPDGQLRTVAGVGPRGVVAGDGGLATNASLGNVGGLAVDGEGNVYFSEADHARVRKILARPPAFSASPLTLEFSAASAGPPPRPQTVNVLASVPSVGFNVRIRTASGGAWLSAGITAGVTPRLLQVTVSPAALAPGTYTGNVDLDAPNGDPRAVTIAVRFTVGAALAPNLQVDRTSLSFTYPRTAQRRAQQLLLSNSGSGQIAYEAVVGAGSFLTVTPARGTVTASAPFALRVEADPARRAPGTYRDAITVRWSGRALTINAVMTISDREQAILLSQSGLSFQAVAQGGVTPPQSFRVINTGNGVMPWRVATSTLAGGAAWLKVSPETGATDAASATVPSVQVSIDQTGLEPGVYYGLVQVESAGAANTPHVLTVALEVLPPGARPGSVVQPRELTFRVPEGFSTASEELTIFNLTGDTVGYRSSAQQLSPTQDVVYAPIDAPVAPREPQRVVVQPRTWDLPAGTHRASMAFQFDDGTVRQVDLAVVVARGGAASAKIDPKRGAEGCTAEALVPSVRSLGQAASVPAGWPAGVVVEVQDDCGKQVDTGAVTMSFSNGDPPVAMQPVRDGLWHGTWASRSASGGSVTVKIQAEDRAANLQGEREVVADLRAAYDPPEIRTDGVLNSGIAADTPLSPGALIEINGGRMTANLTLNAPARQNLPTRLEETEVVVAGRRIPLFSAAPDKIAAVLPYDLPPNTLHQVLVRRGLTYSRPAPVNVAAAQPSILLNTAAGATQALAEIRRDGATVVLNSTASPARAGDRLAILCGGLGAVNPAVEAGVVTPASPASRTTQPVLARIGGVAATVSEASLVPGEIGRYQVVVTVPSGVAAGDAVPVEVEAQGLVSPRATLVVR